MADEQVAQMPLFAQLAHQVQDLALDGHVQRRQRLVSHDQFRLRPQCAGNGNALALAPGELVRIAVQRVYRQTHLRNQLTGAVGPLRPVADAVDQQRLSDHIGYRQPWVQ